MWPDIREALPITACSALRVEQVYLLSEYTQPVGSLSTSLCVSLCASPHLLKTDNSLEGG